MKISEYCTLSYVSAPPLLSTTLPNHIERICQLNQNQKCQPDLLRLESTEVTSQVCSSIWKREWKNQDGESFFYFIELYSAPFSCYFGYSIRKSIVSHEQVCLNYFIIRLTTVMFFYSLHFFLCGDVSLSNILLVNDNVSDMKTLPSCS